MIFKCPICSWSEETDDEVLGYTDLYLHEVNWTSAHPCGTDDEPPLTATDPQS